MEMKDMHAVVTGGASGLGRATAEAIIAAGGRASLIDRDAETLLQVAETIGARGYAGDVTSAEEMTGILERCEQDQGPLRGAVNCAGIAPAAMTLSKDGTPADLDQFAKVVQVNLIGTYNVLRLAAARMQRHDPLGEAGERGVVINTASVAAYEGQMGQTAYAASKGGVAGLTLPAARDLARYGIRVMTIAPGVFWTPMMESFPQKVQDSLNAQVPFPNRLGTACEYAALARHIIENPYLNGTTIRLDGAIRMGPK